MHLLVSLAAHGWHPAAWRATGAAGFEDVAPFAQFPNDFLLNLVNGFGSADGWPLIVNLDAPDQPPLDWVLGFRRKGSHAN